MAAPDGVFAKLDQWADIPTPLVEEEKTQEPEVVQAAEMAFRRPALRKPVERPRVVVERDGDTTSTLIVLVALTVYVVLVSAAFSPLVWETVVQIKRALTS